MGIHNYELMKKFILQLTYDFPVGPHKTHFSVIPFAWSPVLYFGLNDPTYYDPLVLRPKILDVPFLEGGSRIDRAFKLVHDKVFCSTCGPRQNKRKILIVLTDGDASPGSVPVHDAAKPLKDDGVTIISVGIGRKIKPRTLERMASCEELFFPFSAYTGMVGRLRDKNLICTPYERCGPFSCHNGGQCIEPRRPGHFGIKCICRKGFTGKRCRNDLFDIKFTYIHNYYLGPKPLTFPEAQAHCKALGGNLAHVDSLEENNFLRNVLLKRFIPSAYIGFTNRFTEGAFKWISGHKVCYSNWITSYPAPNHGNYAVITGNGGWINVPGSKKFRYFCKR